MNLLCACPLLAALLLFVDLTLANNYAIVLDTSENMKGNRLTAVRQALRSFVLDATENTRIAVIGFGNHAKRYSKSLVPLSSLENKQLLLDSLPTHKNLKGSTSVPVMGIKKALKLLRQAAVPGQNIVVITASSETEGPGPYLNQTKLIEKVDTAQVVVYGIAIGSQAVGDSFMKICQRDRGPGKLFYESEMPGQPYRIVDALIRIAQDSDSNRLQHLYTGMFNLSLNQQWIQEVTMDSSVGHHTVFYISWMGSISPDPSALDFKLRAPNRTKVTRGYSCSKLFHMCQYNIPKHAENGTWTMEVVNRMSDTVVSLSALALSRSVGQNPIKIYTKILTKLTPYYIWAEVKQGNIHVQGANVTALVTRPNMPPVSIQLHPYAGGDISRGKGGYRATFNEISGDGWYNVYVTATATKNHQLPHKPQQTYASTKISEDLPPELLEEEGRSLIEPPAVTAFTRMQAAGAFPATGYGDTAMPQPDNIKPNNVVDLRIIQPSLTCSNGAVTMTWTAPGDDQESGRASRYDVRISTDRSSFSKNFTMQVAVKPEDVLPQSPSSLDNPQPAGTPEKLIFRCSICTPGILVFFSLKTVDESDNWSDAAFYSFAKVADDATNCPESSPQTPQAPTDEEVTTEPPVTSRVGPEPELPMTSRVELESEPPVTSLVGPEFVDVPDIIRHAQFTPTVSSSASPAQPEHISSNGSFNQPLSMCRCVRLRIKDHVCQDSITYKGKVVEVVNRTDGQEELTLSDVRSYTTSVPTGFNLTNTVTLTRQCPRCKQLKKNRYYIFSAVLNTRDEKFYIRNSGMVRQLSMKPERVISTLKRISTALNKCQ